MHFLAESRKMISFLVTPTEKAIQYTVYVFYNVTSAGIISCQTSFRNVRKVVTASTYGLFVHYLYNFFHLYLYNLFICTYTICSYLLVLYNLFKCTCTIWVTFDPVLFKDPQFHIWLTSTKFLSKLSRSLYFNYERTGDETICGNNKKGEVFC